MKRRQLGGGEHVARNIRPRLLHITEEGETVIDPQAFRLRLKGEHGRPDDEPYVSASWLECFAGSEDEKFAEVLSSSIYSLKPNAGIAICNVGKLEECGDQHGQTIKCWHEPKEYSVCYAAIRGIQVTDPETENLKTKIAGYAVTSFKRVRDI